MRRLPFAVASLLTPSLVLFPVPRQPVPAGEWPRDFPILVNDSLAGGDTGTDRVDNFLQRLVKLEAS